jgi:hypothetical protein
MTYQPAVRVFLLAVTVFATVFATVFLLLEVLLILLLTMGMMRRIQLVKIFLVFILVMVSWMTKIENVLHSLLIVLQSDRLSAGQ